MRLNMIGKGLLVLLVLIVAYAWIDGGRETQRLIEQRIELRESAR